VDNLMISWGGDVVIDLPIFDLEIW